MTPIDYFSAPYLQRKAINASIDLADALIKAKLKERPSPDVNGAAIAMVAPVAPGRGTVASVVKRVPSRAPGSRLVFDLFDGQGHHSTRL